MFSISKFNLQLKKNSKIFLSDFCTSKNVSLLCIYESSSSSDTGNLFFIQQSLDNGSFKNKKLIWITESAILSFSINPTCDWIVIAYRGGMLCILPIGAMMGRHQKKNDNWKSNDVTYLSNKLKAGTVVTCMKWWTSYKEKNMCIIGRSDGDLLIIDLSNGSTLFVEKFPEFIQSIDLLHTPDKSLSYCFITTRDLNQWKLLLEEIHDKDDVPDSEFGFDVLEFSNMHSSNIIYSKSRMKPKGKEHTNPSYLPSKLYQFPKTTFLKSQYYNGKYFLGAYDNSTGKYKLFDCENLDSSLYEFQLPMSVVDICVTEDFLFIVIEQAKADQESENKPSSKFTSIPTLKFCVICRQFAHSRILEKPNIMSILKKKEEPKLMKPTVPISVPNRLSKSLFAEFDLPGLYSSTDVLAILHFPAFFNFLNAKAMCTEKQPISPKKSLWTSHIQRLNKKVNSSLTKNEFFSKWAVEEIKLIAPVFLISSSDISVCYMSQCFEDKCIEHLLSYEIEKADKLGAGLKLDMNELYRHTAQLLTSGVVQLGEKVSKSKKSVILEYFELASAPVKIVLDCLSQFWSIDKCLVYALSQTVHIHKMSPSNRTFLSNAIIQLFGYVMSDPFDSIDGFEKKRNKYFDKFRRFVLGNCFFNDLVAAKTMFQFGLVDEAFFIAKEKGCLLDLFSFMIENNYNTKWFDCFPDELTKEKYIFDDRDFVLSSIGIPELGIIAEHEPKMIKSLAEFICDLFSVEQFSQKKIFSFQTTTHLCTIFNPYGAIIDTLFRLYASTNIVDMYGKREVDKTNINLSLMFNQNLNNSTKDSLDDANTFSETFKICREIGPELLAYCLLVVYKDNQIEEIKDYIYFTQIYAIIISADEKQDFPSNLQTENIDLDAYKSMANMVTWNKNFKQKRNVLSVYWTKLIKPKLLYLKEEICISISVLDIDLFAESEEEVALKNNRLVKSKKDMKEIPRSASISLSEAKPNQKCQIKLLGFNNEKSNKILLLPKAIENGKEIIRQIAMGKQHVLILTESGSLYVAGTNDCGQLGIGKLNHVNRRKHSLNIINPILLNMELEKTETILSIAAGDYHSGAIVVSTSNIKQKSYVFTWGWGVHGQLGHSNVDDQKFPKRLNINFNKFPTLNENNSDEFPIELAMGCFHSIILTNKGRVYAFGNNHNGQLGTGTISKSTVPIPIRRLPQTVTHIDTKYFHSSCCTSTNEIYTWGIHPNLWLNSVNQSKSLEDVSKPELVDTNNLLVNQTISQISCGTSHTTIITQGKLVYCFGSNIWGQLGTGTRKEINKLIEVKLPVPIDFISSDDGITVATHISEKSTKIFVWGRCSHPLIQEHLKNLMCDTVKPQIILEYQHVIENNLLWKNCFGMDTVLNEVSRIISKQQLMIIFFNFSKYIDRCKFLEIFEALKEYDIISDYFLMNESVVQSLFWRIKSLINRLSKITDNKSHDVIEDDIEIIFKFYLRLTEIEKYQCLKKSILSMITGFIKTHNIPWSIFENIMRPLLETNSFAVADNFMKFSLESVLSSEFIKDLLLCLTEDNLHNLLINENIEQIEITSKDIERFHDLIRSGKEETIYDAADDHKVVFFSGCGHASVIGRFKEQQLKQAVDKFRKRQLNLSSQMIQRLYSDSSIFPDCLDCLLQTLKF